MCLMCDATEQEAGPQRTGTSVEPTGYFLGKRQSTAALTSSIVSAPLKLGASGLHRLEAILTAK
jgi:hypothetical protein